MGAHLGQHFLRAPAVVEDILAAAHVQPGESVLEIGPGDGVLTLPLADAVGPGGHLVAVEADGDLARVLRPQLPPHAVLHRGDAVRVDLQALGPFDRVVSNLPYQISGPIIAKLLGLPWKLAVLMVQREFGRRLMADPGSKTYGRLSVHAARRVAVERVRSVPPGCFDPPPRVESVVLRLTPHEEPPFSVADEQLWRTVVDGAFNQRRKTLGNALGSVADRLGIDAARLHQVLQDTGCASKRAEQLAPQEFAHLADRIFEERA